MHMYTHIYMYTYTNAYMRSHTHAHTHIPVHTLLNNYAHACTQQLPLQTNITCMCVNLYIIMHAHIHTHTCTSHARTHTHTRTHKCMKTKDGHFPLFFTQTLFTTSKHNQRNSLLQWVYKSIKKYQNDELKEHTYEHLAEYYYCKATQFRPVPIFVLLTWNWFVRTNFCSTNERLKEEEEEGKGRGRERKRKGKGEREIGSEALAETGKNRKRPMQPGRLRFFPFLPKLHFQFPFSPFPFLFLSLPLPFPSSSSPFDLSFAL